MVIKTPLNYKHSKYINKYFLCEFEVAGVIIMRPMSYTTIRLCFTAYNTFQQDFHCIGSLHKARSTKSHVNFRVIPS